MSGNSSTATSSVRELVTLAEVARRLGMSIQQVRRLARRGEFGPVYTGARDRRRCEVERARVETFRRFYQSPTNTK